VFWLDWALVMLPAVLPRHTETISERVVIHATVADFLALLINFILHEISQPFLISGSAAEYNLLSSTSTERTSMAADVPGTKTYSYSHATPGG
jgi:hypothetical protein